MQKLTAPKSLIFLPRMSPHEAMSEAGTLRI